MTIAGASVPVLPTAVTVVLVAWLVALTVLVVRARRKCRWEAQRAASRVLADARAIRDVSAQPEPSSHPTGPICINGRSGSTARGLRGTTPNTTPIRIVGRHTQL